jgi:hypothetical protein
MAKIARQRSRVETQPDKIGMGYTQDVTFYNVDLKHETSFQQHAYARGPQMASRDYFLFFFTFALKPRKTSRSPLTNHGHVGAAPTRTAQNRPADRRTTPASYAQTTCRAPVLVNSRAHAAQR